LAQWCHEGLWPDRTYLFDLPPAVAAQRRGGREAAGASADRFEQEQTAFFDRVRTNYLQLTAIEPGRFYRIDAQKAPDLIWKLLEEDILTI
jgi:dTMP kinase